MSGWLLCQADARRLPLADNSVSMCVTSPPYYGLRDYQTGRWEGGSEVCDHVDPGTNRGRREELPNPPAAWAERAQGVPYRDICRKCGARRVDRQLGLEATPSEYCAAMVRVFREVWRVLHPSGVVFLNIGDSYAGAPAGNSPDKPSGFSQKKERWDGGCVKLPPRRTGVKNKDLLGIPWMLAFALRDDGWYLRDAVIWSKADVDEYDELEGSAMPGSQRDRCTSAYEFVFMLSKRARYYYDPEACKTKSGAMLRNVWRINPEPTKHKHYATYPRELVRRCVLLGSSSKGVCPECGAPWDRVVKRSVALERGRRLLGLGGKSLDYPSHPPVPGVTSLHHDVTRSTLGWRPGCAHGHDPIPALILDPFCGSATTGVVATALGRRFIGLDLSREYLTDQAMRRLERPHAAPIRPARDEPMPLFDGAAP